MAKKVWSKRYHCYLENVPRNATERQRRSIIARNTLAAYHVLDSSQKQAVDAICRAIKTTKPEAAGGKDL